MIKDSTSHHLIDKIIADVFGPDSLLSSEVKVAPDHDGDESLFIYINLADKEKLKNIELQNEFRELLVRNLRELADYRFPYIRYDYGDSQLIMPDKISFKTRKSAFR